MPRRPKLARATSTPARPTAAEASAPKSIEERVLREVFALYKEPSMVSKACGNVGIEAMSRHVGREQLHPSKKITVMIVGNHSAGKSSFVNWYTKQAELQRTGVAVESQGFTIVTRGQRKDLVKGASTIEMKPYLRGIEKFEGVMDHLEVRVSTSDANEFPTVDFLDTPGLIDGEVSYPFDVNNIIVWLARHVDLIFVFMDPVGQALCTRTMNVVKALDKARYGGKMKFFITKADQVPRALDLQNIITQTVANLSRHVSDHHGLKVNTMWIQGREGAVPEVNPESNYLGHLVKDISETVRQKAQVNMSRLQDDCATLSKAIDKESHDTAEKLSTRCRWLAYEYFIGGVLCPIVVIASFLDLVVHFEDSLPAFITSAPAAQALLNGARRPMQLAAQGGEHLGLMSMWQRQGFAVCVFLFLYTLMALFAWRVRRLKYRTKNDLAAFRDYKQKLAVIMKKGAAIRTQYLQETQRPEGTDYE